jgi:regulator of protease activity HflC (stomatin/prohibitin superfamily)
VLRDEFGRFSAVEVADPSSYTTARVRSTERLNEYLEPHGIRILQIITPKPRFDARYEEAIEERKVADQEVERLKQRELQLLQERERELALVQKEKEIQWEELQGDLKKRELESQREAIQITKEADRYKVTREAEGQQQLDRLTAESQGLVAKYTKEAEGIRARAEALEARGRVVVREALIEKLSRISFTLVPYSRDPMPKRLEHSDARGSVEELSGAINGGQQ